MKGKTFLIFGASVALFTLAATYRFHDSAHSIGVIKKGGGVARHSALLDKGRDSYILIATAAVIPPYRGNARVVLEGDPTLTATFHNSEVPVDLGFFRHPEFRDNTYYDLRPKDKVALWVKIKRTQEGSSAPGVVIEGKGAPPCVQCEPDEATEQTAGSERKDVAQRTSANQSTAWRNKGGGQPKGPAVAFYDAASNEPLLKIPIRFIGEGGGDAHGR